VFSVSRVSQVCPKSVDLKKPISPPAYNVLLLFIYNTLTVEENGEFRSTYDWEKITVVKNICNTNA
jgi:hypothetical protein